jgi:hypothetical protein
MFMSIFLFWENAGYSGKRVAHHPSYCLFNRNTCSLPAREIIPCSLKSDKAHNCSADGSLCGNKKNKLY